MTQVLPLIEAYGTLMAKGDVVGAQEQLRTIEAAMADNGDDQFEAFWDEMPGRLAKAGPMEADAVKKMCELVWWESRGRLIKGEAHRPETPKFLGPNNVIQTRP